MHSKYWIKNQIEPILVDNFSMMPSFQNNVLLLIIIIIFIVIVIQFYLNYIIIHSKYFPDSDWLKAPA